jgi:hypothetical protein
VALADVAVAVVTAELQRLRPELDRGDVRSIILALRIGRDGDVRARPAKLERRTSPATAAVGDVVTAG